MPDTHLFIAQTKIDLTQHTLTNTIGQGTILTKRTQGMTITIAVMITITAATITTITILLTIITATTSVTVILITETMTMNSATIVPIETITIISTETITIILIETSLTSGVLITALLTIPLPEFLSESVQWRSEHESDPIPLQCWRWRNFSTRASFYAYYLHRQSRL